MTQSLPIHCSGSAKLNFATPLQPSDWLPIAEASDLTGIPLRTLAYHAKSQWLRRGLAELRPPRSGQGKPTWWVHRSVSRKLSPYPDGRTRDDRVRDSLLTKHPEPHVEHAYRKAYWLRKWRDRCAKPRVAGRTERSIAADVAVEAHKIEGEAFRISARTLQQWWRAYNTLGDDGRILGVAALVPLYAGPRQSTISNLQSPISNRSQDAVDFFFSIYHSQAKHSVTTCHEATVVMAKRKGWCWPKSYAATVKWIRQTERRDETCLYREGRTAYSKRFMPYIEIDYTVLEPGELYVLDHTQCDFWCRYGAETIRPWLTTIIDARSRLLVGHQLGPSPHQDAILAAMRMAFRDWSIPRKVHIDRGKDFTSQLLTGVTKRERNRLRRQLGPGWRDIVRHQQDVFWHGILGELGIEICEANPYSPWSKGLKERWYRTFEDHCAKTFVTYCGNKPEARPECLQDILRKDSEQDIPALEACRPRVADSAELYNRSSHRGTDMNGATPLAVWSTASSVRKAVESQLLALMQARGVYRVHANGVSFRIRSRTITYGATSAALRAFVGRDVLVTLDSDHCECCFAYTADRDSRRLIGRIEANERIPANTSVDELSEAIRRVRRRRKTFERAQREAPQRLRTAAHEVAALRREQLAELRKTGTDDATARPNIAIAVVRTGFEGVSTPARIDREPPLCAPADPADLKDLFDDTPALVDQGIDDGIEDLLDGAPAVISETDDVEDLLEDGTDRARLDDGELDGLL